METTYLVVERHPLKLDETSEVQTPASKITEVKIAVKKGMEVQIGSPGMVNPDTECWFAVTLAHPWTKKNNTADFDTIITDGEQFFLCRRDLGASKLVFNESVKKRILTSIERFTSRLIHDKALHSEHRGQDQAD